MAIGGCSNEVSYDELQDRDGLKYKVWSQTPFTGINVFYHDNGQLDYKSNWKDGKIDGLEEGYFEDGQLEYKGNYKDGERDGLHERYDENGQLIFKTNWSDGKKIPLTNPD